MNPKIKLVVAESNTKWTKLLFEYLSGNSDIELCGTAVDGAEACNIIRRDKPDVVIINMILPNIDGLGVIENINKTMRDKPRIICISTVQNDYMVKKAFACGAAYFATLPIEIPVIVQRVMDIAGGGNAASGKIMSSATDSVDERVTSILLAIGIPANIKGYPYLREAVNLAIKEPDMVNKITKELYPEIAQRFNTSASKVERAVRHAIDVAWNRGRIKNMNEIFGIEIYSANDRPTNGEFIALVADRIKLAFANAK